MIEDHEMVVEKVHALMRKLSFSIPVAMRFEQCSLAAQCANVTRWSSTFLMLKRFVACHQVCCEKD